MGQTFEGICSKKTKSSMVEFSLSKRAAFLKKSDDREQEAGKSIFRSRRKKLEPGRLRK
jgi:hypothetical protein